MTEIGWPRRMALALAAGAALWLAIGAAARSAGEGALPTERLVIATRQGEFAFNVEVADDDAERERGLMFRETMPSDHGMLFVFGETRDIVMWMKNTPMALDMAFAGPDGTVVWVAERTKPYSLDTISPGLPVSHVLEVRAGVARLIGLKPGDRLRHPSFAER
jgi:uncharacterized membrane protein (UPF0127 family)